LIDAKASGRKIAVVPRAASKTPVIDLMEALKKSLANKTAVAAEKKPTVVRASKTERKQGRKAG